MRRYIVSRHGPDRWVIIDNQTKENVSLPRKGALTGKPRHEQTIDREWAEEYSDFLNNKPEARLICLTKSQLVNLLDMAYESGHVDGVIAVKEAAVPKTELPNYLQEGLLREARATASRNK